MNTKKCPRCHKIKPIEEFNFKNRKKEIRQSHCKTCHSKESKKFYQKYKKYYLSKAAERNKKTREENAKYIYNYLKKHPCTDCGESNPIVLEFDHINNDKQYNVSYLTRGFSLNTLKKEISKCEVRCANCHRKKTAKQFNYISYQFFVEECTLETI